MKWVLIIFFSLSNSGKAIDHIEFTTAEQCMTVQALIMRQVSGTYVICVGKD